MNPEAAATHPYLEQPFAIRWNELTPEHIAPDIARALEATRARVETIATLPLEQANFENTFLALDEATEDLRTAWGFVSHLDSVMNNPDHRAAYNAMLPEVSDFFANIPLDDRLWRVLKHVAEQPDTRALSGTRGRFRDETLADFREAGADLPSDKKDRLAAIEQALSQKTQKFSENALDSLNAFELVIEDEDRLRGLPPSALDAAREAARKKGLGSDDQPVWRFTLHAPSFVPIMQYAEDSELRRTLYEAYHMVGRKNPHDNTELIREILRLRAEKARLLGKPHFADCVLERRMAGSGSAALAFVHDLHERTRPGFEREVSALERFKAEETGNAVEPLEPWDFLFWSERLRRRRFEFDAEELRPYFPIHSVITGMFRICERLFGLEIQERDDDRPQAWHDEVQFYDVRDQDGRHLGSFYADWHPRESKRGGAWMNHLRTGGPLPEGGRAPHLGLICGNLTPPLRDQPALLTHDEVLTIFHEFGHLLHHLLGDVDIKSLNGVAVAWDFVELPSQILENWAWEKEGLDLFARHYQTGDPIPDALFAKMTATRQFGAAHAMMRQLSFGKLDLELHTCEDPFLDRDMDDAIARLLEGYRPRTKSPPAAFIRNFSHLFSSPVGYAAGYYSYKWAEVLAADAFTRFKNEGILHVDVGRAFRDAILSRGNSDEPGTLYREFMGRDPDITPLLVQEGLHQAP